MNIFKLHRFRERAKPGFTAEECGAQRGHTVYPRAYSKLVQEPGLKLVPPATDFASTLGWMLPPRLKCSLCALGHACGPVSDCSSVVQASIHSLNKYIGEIQDQHCPLK